MVWSGVVLTVFGGGISGGRGGGGAVGSVLVHRGPRGGFHHHRARVHLRVLDINVF